MPREPLRERLIASGLALLESDAGGSAETLTLRGVAGAAGVSHAAAYRHFEDKNDLLAAIAEEGFRLFYDYQLRALEIEEPTRRPAGEPEVAWRIRSLGWTYVRFSLEHPGYARIMYGAVGFEFRSYPGLVAASGRTFRLLLQAIRAGQREGVIAPGRLKHKTLAAWAMVHGTAMLLLDGRVRTDPQHPERTRELVLAIIEHAFTGMSYMR